MNAETKSRVVGFGKNLSIIGEAVLVSTALCLMEVEGGGTIVILLLILAFAL